MKNVAMTTVWTMLIAWWIGLYSRSDTPAALRCFSIAMGLWALSHFVRSIIREELERKDAKWN